MKRMIVKIGQTGKVKEEMEGYSGDSCFAVSDAVKDLVGKHIQAESTGVELKDEYNNVDDGEAEGEKEFA